MEKVKKDLKKIKKAVAKPSEKVKGLSFPVRHGKLGPVVTR